MLLGMLHYLSHFPLHRIERMVRAIHHPVHSRPGDRFTEKQQPSNSRTTHAQILVLLGRVDGVPDSLYSSTKIPKSWRRPMMILPGNSPSRRESIDRVCATPPSWSPRTGWGTSTWASSSMKQ